MVGNGLRSPTSLTFRYNDALGNKERVVHHYRLV
jgi:hypothetical protein